MSQPAASISVVRVCCKNQITFEFQYEDVGRATEAVRTLATAKNDGNAHPPKPASCQIYDDAGRQTFLEGSMIMSVQFVDLEREVYLGTKFRIMLSRQERALLAAAGEVASGGASQMEEPQGSHREVPRGIGAEFSA